MSNCTCGYNVCAWCLREISREFGPEAAREFQPNEDPPQTLAEMDAEDAAFEAKGVNDDAREEDVGDLEEGDGRPLARDPS